jgi:isocitrate/isopropylmalate dehydrogenase
MAMLLAVGAVLHYAAELGHEGAERASRAVYEAVLEGTAAGIRTPDLGGQSTMSEVAGDVAGRVKAKLSAWEALGT